nr:E4 SUMO-protein ligase PIAL2-like [Tanacetum cinerariifolium]
MKMGHMFSLVVTKPGCDSYVTDLHISKNAKTLPDDNIYLFVAQADNMETSSCINVDVISWLLLSIMLLVCFGRSLRTFPWKIDTRTKKRNKDSMFTQTRQPLELNDKHCLKKRFYEGIRMSYLPGLLCNGSSEKDKFLHFHFKKMPKMKMHPRAVKDIQ